MRKAITISLDPDTWTLVEEAAALEGGNVSAAIRAFITGDITNAQAKGHTIAVSEAGWAVLDQLATSKGRTVDEVAKLALRYATQHSTKWL